MIEYIIGISAIILIGFFILVEIKYSRIKDRDKADYIRRVLGTEKINNPELNRRILTCMGQDWFWDAGFKELIKKLEDNGIGIFR
jgi:hypothetical protein